MTERTDSVGVAQHAGSIAVYGATGYTARYICTEARRRGIALVLVGRSRERLTQVAQTLGGAEVRTASLDDHQALVSAFGGCMAVVSCAGPFEIHGEPVVRAALHAGVHYLDITGEQTYVRRLLERYDAPARRRGIAVLPASGVDSIPGDMLASVASHGMPDPDKVDVAIHFGRGRPNKGTLLSVLELGRRNDELEWVDGRLARPVGGRRRGRWQFGGDVGEQCVMRFPGVEALFVPRHVSTRAAQVALSTQSFASGPLVAKALPYVVACGLRLARTPVHRLLSWGISALPEPREDVPVRIECVVRSGEAHRAAWFAAPGSYKATAQLVAEAATRVMDPAFSGAGVLAPSEAFQPAEFLKALVPLGLRFGIDVEPTLERDGASSGAENRPSSEDREGCVR